MNKTTALKKREHCYLIRSGEENFIFKKRFLGKKIKILLSEEAYIEKAFRFVRVFTDETLHVSQRETNLVIRREHRKNIQTIVEQAGLIDYNFILEERKRIKAEERAAKIKQMKDDAAEKISATGNKVKGAFGGLFSRKKEKV